MIVIPVRYVRAARFPSIETARATYRHLRDLVIDADRRYDLGVAVVVWQNDPVLVVTAIEEPPPDVQAIVSDGLAHWEEWTPPDSLIQAIALRRMRQMANREGVVQPSGLHLYERNGMQYVDQQGRDVTP